MKGVEYLGTYLNPNNVKKALNESNLSERDVNFLMEEYEIFHFHLEKKIIKGITLDN